ncbi:hypothetical protein DPMN_179507 [Dreissena polymorpha]|uniref:Uncharacterized protein n=1 Tax=Dreissena polymorpha TaxID=45954 RepID=A0A9D4IM83_DREPO|nr:hypothetical protein DPMN_179507 [Dreissena polymorpha]
MVMESYCDECKVMKSYSDNCMVIKSYCDVCMVIFQLCLLHEDRVILGDCMVMET